MADVEKDKINKAFELLDAKFKQDVLDCENIINKALEDFKCGLQFIKVEVNGQVIPVQKDGSGSHFKVVNAQ